MAYTPTTWTDGDVITAEKLNKLEQAVKTASGAKKGASGACVTAISLTTAKGKVIGGTCTLSDGNTVEITVTEA